MKQTTLYTIITHALLGLMLTVFSIGIPTAPQAGASERTGRIISEIVNSMDSEMEKFESFAAQSKKDIDILTLALDNWFDALNKADNPMDVKRNQANILLDSIRLNACEIKKNKASMETVAFLIPMMTRLNEEYTKFTHLGFENQAAYREFRGHLGTHLINSGRMIQQMKKMSDAIVLKDIPPTLKETVISVKKMFDGTGIKKFEGSEPFIDRIADLENTYDLLESTQLLLEKERIQIKHYILINQVRLGLHIPDQTLCAYRCGPGIKEQKNVEMSSKPGILSPKKFGL